MKLVVKSVTPEADPASTEVVLTIIGPPSIKVTGLFGAIQTALADGRVTFSEALMIVALFMGT